MIDIRERKASLHLDLARAFNQWGKYDRAFEALCTAEQVAPQELTERPSSHLIVLDTCRNAPPSVRHDVNALAARIGAA